MKESEHSVRTDQGETDLQETPTIASQSPHLSKYL